MLGDIEQLKKKIKKLQQEKDDLKMTLELNDDNAELLKKERDQLKSKLNNIDSEHLKAQKDNLTKIEEQSATIKKLSNQIQEMEVQLK